MRQNSSVVLSMIGHLHKHWVRQFCSQSPLTCTPYRGSAYPEPKLTILLAFTTASGCTQNSVTCHPTLSSVNRLQKNLSSCPKLLDHHIKGYRLFHGRTPKITPTAISACAPTLGATAPVLVPVDVAATSRIQISYYLAI